MRLSRYSSGVSTLGKSTAVRPTPLPCDPSTAIHRAGEDRPLQTTQSRFKAPEQAVSLTIALMSQVLQNRIVQRARENNATAFISRLPNELLIGILLLSLKVWSYPQSHEVYAPASVSSAWKTIAEITPAFCAVVNSSDSLNLVRRSISRSREHRDD